MCNTIVPASKVKFLCFEKSNLFFSFMICLYVFAQDTTGTSRRSIYTPIASNDYSMNTISSNTTTFAPPTALQMQLISQAVDAEGQTASLSSYQCELRQCSMCSYTTRDNSNMIRHIRGHSDLKPFKCPYCSYRSKQKVTLQRHIEVHKKRGQLS